MCIFSYKPIHSYFTHLANIHNFEKASKQESTNVEQSIYDPDSVMHYNKHAFSKNGKPTIQLIGDKNKELGQRQGMSVEDLVQLNRLYRCEGNEDYNTNTLFQCL